ncbi:MAG: serine/threonine-protein kinase [Kofleriaceae bacterium]
MTEQEQFAAAMDLVDRALEASASERAAILASCADAEIRARAQRLLDADAGAGSFLEAPAHLPGLTIGATIGPFQIRALLGRGGMGEVWLGERVGADFAQRVAIKILPFAGDRDAVARFRRERRVLARLDDPRIAKLLDGGVTGDGRPWLAMELVEGLELLEACRGKPLAAKLRLFAEICDAVQAAHRSLVIHRDLKPSNILVTADGMPKLLDFGIAKLITAEGDSDGGLTRTSERPMTLHYASPEQIRGGAITVASDVWSLGVILHEILVGARPYTGPSRVETEAAILAAVPARPSTKLRGPQARELRGDLDAIVMKALRAAPGERYASAEALGADLRHHLARAPVAARGDATSYLLRAMVGRHRAGFAVAALAIVLMVAGIAGTVWQARLARDQRAKAERVSNLAVGLLESFDPDRVTSRPLSQPEILERGSARLSELASDPDAQARLLVVFAQTWLDLSDHRHALPLANRAVMLGYAFDPDGLGLAQALEVRGHIEYDMLDLVRARYDFADALQIATDVEGGAGLTVATLLSDRADVERKAGEFADAEAELRRALAIVTGWRGPRDPAAIRITNGLALLLADEGRYAESRALQLEACAGMRATTSADHTDVLICRANVARDDLELGHVARADHDLAEVIADETAIYGPDGSELPRQLVLRARALDQLGHGRAALAMVDDALDRAAQHFGRDSAEVGDLSVWRARVLIDLGRAGEAEAVARRAIALCETAQHDAGACHGRSREALGRALLAEGRTQEAREQLETAVLVERTVFGENHPETRATHAVLEGISP